MRRRIINELTKIDTLQHPLGEGSGWMIAVSRRFTSPQVDEIYRQAIRPTLERHGHVVECLYADDSQQSADFWLNRMRLILEMADLHVLIEHNISSRVFTEHMQSLALVMPRHPQGLMLRSVFGDDHIASQVPPSPGVLVITPHVSRAIVRYNYRSAIVSMPFSGGSHGAADHLEDAIILLKRILLLPLQAPAMRQLGLKNYFDFVLSRGTREDVETARRIRHEWVTLLGDPDRIPEYQDLLSDVRDQVKGRSALMAYVCDVIDGKVDVPRSFQARYRIARKLFHETFDSASQVPLLSSLLFGPIIASLAFRLPKLSQLRTTDPSREPREVDRGD